MQKLILPLVVSFAAFAAVAAGAAPAWAHHSFAMFDASKTTTYKGVVKEVQWTNPHVWVELVPAGGDPGKSVSLEGPAIGVLKRVGWLRDTVKPGDMLTVTSHPFKSGQPGGSLEAATLQDGRALKTTNGIPSALVVESAK